MILDQDEKARNSDSYLYLRVLRILGKEKDMDVENMPITLFLINMSEWGFPAFETVRRTRQKIQEQFPEYSANNRVKTLRAEKEAEFKEYARGTA